MNKIFTLFLCGLTLSFAACKDDEGTAGDVEFRFGKPVATDISGTVASVSCKAVSGAAALESVASGFLCGTESDAVGDYAEVDAAVDGDVISCRLSGLKQNTNYRVLAYADFGTQRMVSEAVSFKTLEVKPGEPMLEITSQTTLVVDAEAEVYTITYEVTNPTAGVVAEASSESEWLHEFDNATEGEISFIVDQSTEIQARSGAISVTYLGAEPCTVTVTQKAAIQKPVLEITSQTTVVAPAAEDRYTITYTVANPVVGGKASASSEASWLKSFDSSADGKITFTAAANTGARRTGIVKVIYPNAEMRQVTVSQEAGEEKPGETKVVELTVASGFPKTYQGGSFKLGDYNYTLSSVANYGNGIQFKSTSGAMSNADDMGAILKIELVYNGTSPKKNVGLCLGDAPKPSGATIAAVAVDGVYTFDCAATPHPYFSLVNGDGAAYVNTIKIYIGEGGVTPPEPGTTEPAFGTPSYSNLTKNSATIACSYTYTGQSTVSEVYFLYRTSTGTDQRINQTADQGVKSAALTGLTPATLYTFRLCVVVEGKTYTGGSSTFVTDNEAGQPSGGVYKTGWAELPKEVDKSGDYYYAYHMRDDAKSIRNFSVCYSKKYGCPVWVAAPMHKCYTGSSGRNDAYKQDPKLGCSQVGKRDGYTRGHMLGSSDRTVSVSTNKQVFYYSNIGPQLQEGFNQGQGVWNNLEGFVDAQWCADTLYQVIGCHWENTNKTSSGTVIPTHYYKLLLRTKKGNSGKPVMNCTRDELRCAAFYVAHNSSQKYTQPNKNMMKSVAELEAMTGFTFFPNVPNAPKDIAEPSEWGL